MSTTYLKQTAKWCFGLIDFCSWCLAMLCMDELISTSCQIDVFSYGSIESVWSSSPSSGIRCANSLSLFLFWFILRTHHLLFVIACWSHLWIKINNKIISSLVRFWMLGIVLVVQSTPWGWSLSKITEDAFAFFFAKQCKLRKTPFGD